MAERKVISNAEAVFARAKEIAGGMQAREVEARDAKTARLKAERLARDEAAPRAAPEKP